MTWGAGLMRSHVSCLPEPTLHMNLLQELGVKPVPGM